jgi:hypothetical protein
MGPFVSLSWDAVLGATHYEVFYRKDGEVYDPSRKVDVGEPLVGLAQFEAFYPVLTRVFLVIAAADPNAGVIGYLSAEVSFILPFPAPKNLVFA